MIDIVTNNVKQIGTPADEGLSLIHISGEEALKLKETEQYEKDKHLRQAVDYVLDKVAIK